MRENPFEERSSCPACGEHWTGKWSFKEQRCYECNPGWLDEPARLRARVAALEADKARLVAALENADELLCVYGDAPAGAVEHCHTQIRAELDAVKGDGDDG